MPSGLWVDTHLRQLTVQGIPFYIHNKGAYVSGIILLKLNALNGRCRLLIQQRNLDGELGWANATGEEMVDEKKADDYIKRSVDRDPDLWVVEIEGKDMVNPFEGKVFEF